MRLKLLVLDFPWAVRRGGAIVHAAGCKLSEEGRRALVTNSCTWRTENLHNYTASSTCPVSQAGRPAALGESQGPPLCLVQEHTFLSVSSESRQRYKDPTCRASSCLLKATPTESKLERHLLLIVMLSDQLSRQCACPNGKPGSHGRTQQQGAGKTAFEPPLSTWVSRCVAWDCR